MNAQLGRVEHFDAQDVEIAAGPGADDLCKARHADPKKLAFPAQARLLFA